MVEESANAATRVISFGILIPFLTDRHGSNGQGLRLGLSLAEAGHRVEFVCRSADDLASRQCAEHGAAIHYLAGAKFPTLVGDWIYWFRATAYLRKASRPANSVSLSIGVNCLHGTDLITYECDYRGMAGRLLSRRDSRMKAWTLAFHYYLVSLVQTHLFKYAVCIATSAKAASDAQRYRPRSIRTGPPLLSSHMLRSPSEYVAQRLTSQQAGQFRVLLVGNDYRNKGVDILLEALDLMVAQYPGVSLVLVGDLPQIDPRNHRFSIRQLSTGRSLESEFTAANVVALPSRGESLGLPPLEGALRGALPIVSRYAGAAAYVEALGGTVIEDLHPPTLCGALMSAMKGDAFDQQSILHRVRAARRLTQAPDHGLALTVISCAHELLAARDS